MAHEVVFRRINGRIVPIRAENKHEGLKAAGLVAGGLGASAGAGKLAGHFHRDAAHFEHHFHTVRAQARAARSPGPLFDRATGQKAKLMLKEAAMNKLEAKRLFKAGKTIKYAGLALGASLIGAGVHKALGQTRLKKDEKTKATIATGAGLTAAFGVRSGYLSHMAGKTVHGFEILKHAIKRVGARGTVL